jgi:putative NIF3 family GTP cyclohydrolase 1 type 2
MDRSSLIRRLDEDFQIDKCNEAPWETFDLGDYATEIFRKSWKGLVLDNSEIIKKVYTAVFPSAEVLTLLLDRGEEDVLLFTHHPMIWDPNLDGLPFKNIPHQLLEPLQENRISYYAIHVPLDKNGSYSTTVSLARAMGVEPEREFFEYFGALVGVMGKTDRTSISPLVKKVETTVNHRVKVWRYGSEDIRNSDVALVAGGGNEPGIAREIADAGFNTYVTGITRKVDGYAPTIEFHSVCKENAINVIGATHYSTEKFACIAMVDYFEKLGLESEFLPDKPALEDLE